MRRAPKEPNRVEWSPNTERMDKAVQKSLSELLSLVGRLDQRDPYTSTGTHIAVELLARTGRKVRNLSGNKSAGFDAAVDSYFKRLVPREYDGIPEGVDPDA
jgi:hypothetical protein